MVIFYKRSLKEGDNELYAEAIKYRVEKLGIEAEIAGDGIDDALTRNFLINHKYVLIIVTPGLMQDLTALFELDVIQRLFVEEAVKVFAVLKNVVPKQLPERMCWIKQTKYIEPSGVSDIYDAAVNVAAEYWKDRLGSSEYATVEGYLRNRDFYGDRFLRGIGKIYRELENYDFRTRVLVLVIFNRYMFIKSRGLRKYTQHQECVGGMAELVYQGRILAQAELEIINHCILDMLQDNENEI